MNGMSRIFQFEMRDLNVFAAELEYRTNKSKMFIVYRLSCTRTRKRFTVGTLSVRFLSSASTRFTSSRLNSDNQFSLSQNSVVMSSRQWSDQLMSLNLNKWIRMRLTCSIRLSARRANDSRRPDGTGGFGGVDILHKCSLIWLSLVRRFKSTVLFVESIFFSHTFFAIKFVYQSQSLFLCEIVSIWKTNFDLKKEVIIILYVAKDERTKRSIWNSLNVFYFFKLNSKLNLVSQCVCAEGRLSGFVRVQKSNDILIKNACFRRWPTNTGTTTRIAFPLECCFLQPFFATTSKVSGDTNSVR